MRNQCLGLMQMVFQFSFLIFVTSIYMIFVVEFTSEQVMQNRVTLVILNVFMDIYGLYEPFLNDKIS